MKLNQILAQKRYHSLNTFLRAHFGERVQKVTIDAGFSCPNRDGTISYGGCIYCNAFGSGTGAFKKGLSVRTQMLKGIEHLSRRYKVKKFIAYFQAFSNTYGPIDRIKELYDEALVDERVVGLAIGTRPDCVNQEIVELLASYRKRGLMVWLEIGLQSAHNQTLAFINRGHTYEDFVKALELAKSKKLLVCTHVIFGLPGETMTQMLETIGKLAKLPIDGIKFHELYIVRGTKMERLYHEGQYKPLAQNEYVDLVCESLAMLPWKVVIQRLTGDPRPDELVAPDWAREKAKTLRLVEETLLNRDLWQGKYFGEPDPIVKSLG
ncbi:TIGR01212 family radical SAM protein [Thermodesulfatator autotrophicus]|uniref:Radical SAM protein n=1 Tax=Thermodesulfatator autotrophicus TaxID=1795632 RepID=A0A177E4K5_9BACT|nr:TIGR01212 family radical SAM protein [Thermodesulfatator autotrophicus]OAG26884.1 radical SAM protein [Thermodesulfatator autotrophicus]